MDAPLMQTAVLNSKVQRHIKFNPERHTSFSTTGPHQVCFWTTDQFVIEGYKGKVNTKTLGHYSGALVNTTFVGSAGGALSFTDEGYVVVWERKSGNFLASEQQNTMLAATKIVKLVDVGISIMLTIGNYIAIGCKDGAIRFYDSNLRLEAWFEDLAAGPVSSLSFALQDIPNNIPISQFWVPDFIVGTTDALVVGMESVLFQEIRAEDRRGTLLLQGMIDEIKAICCHPSKPLLALACAGGTLQIWDFDLKLLINLRELNNRGESKDKAPKLAPVSMSFDSKGIYLVVGFLDGSLKFISVETLEDITTLSCSADAVVKIVFSPCHTFLACADASGRVILYKNDEFLEGDLHAHKKCPFNLLGRCMAHTGEICGLEFGPREGKQVLISVGADHRCLEYELAKVTSATGIKLKENPVKVELYARPTAALWMPYVGDDAEDKFLIANDDFKFKEVNIESKQCRKTTMYPSFGGVIDKLALVGKGFTDANPYVAFATSEKIVGLARLPLTGNPSKMMGLVAHPGAVSSIACSFDSCFLFTSGGLDLSINMWLIDVSSFEAPHSVTAVRPSEIKRAEMAPFYGLLEGGVDGELYNDIVDYFYICQVRSQGEATMDDRLITGTIVLEQIPYLMRSIGFYPTEEEIVNMINEIRYADFMKTGVLRTVIGLDEFVKLYLNHRPVIPLNNDHIDFAFNEIKKQFGVPESDSLKWSEIQRYICAEGEVISFDDLNACLSALLGADHSQILKSAEMTSLQFADKILGFEDAK